MIHCFSIKSSADTARSLLGRVLYVTLLVFWECSDCLRLTQFPKGPENYLAGNACIPQIRKTGYLLTVRPRLPLSTYNQRKQES